MRTEAYLMQQLGAMKRAGVTSEFRLLAVCMAREAQRAGQPAIVRVVWEEADMSKHPRLERY